MVDFSNAKEGLLVVTIENSGISKIVANAESKTFSIEAGFLAGWFSALNHQDLDACAAMWNINLSKTEYLIGTKSHIESTMLNQFKKI